MPRDLDKYHYVSVSIPRHTVLYAELLADSQASGMSLADVMLLRLSDHYRSLPTRVASPAPQSVFVARSAPESRPVPEVRPVTKPRPTPKPAPMQVGEEIQEYDPARAKQAAAVALATMDLAFDPFQDGDDLP